MKPWSLTSWQNDPYLQSASYPDEKALELAARELATRPPLVSVDEILHLKKAIAQAATGEVFILQGGDCAESFQNCPESLNKQLATLLQMRAILAKEIQKPVMCIARIAGQYAKPRSHDMETQNGISLPSYRGDLINAIEFSHQARTPDPARLLKAHDCATITLRHIRSYLSDCLKNRNRTANIHSRACLNLARRTLPDGRGSDYIYTSHEALHLHYEQALTRQEQDGLWYNRSTHFPWIGMRTAHPDNAHIELLRGIENPIGIKIGPHFNAELFKIMLNKLNPMHEPGRISLITRLGAHRISNLLPSIIQSIQVIKTPVTWICDPMHGNTETTIDGFKTRHFDKILSELEQTIAIHQKMDSILGGVHFELTGEHVTECIGGAQKVQAIHLKDAYCSLMDPRLNQAQSLEMAVALSQRLLYLARA